jgi:ferritin-like metal-binding protein YciE
MKKQPQQKSTAAKKEPENALADFFHDELKDIYWAEKHLVKSLPKMQEAATSPELSKAFGDHLEVTREHVTRLEKVFDLLGHKAVAKKCDGMEGIVKEGEHVIEETEEGSATRDAGLILAAQKVEHYEIATYGCLAQLAKTLGYDEVKEILGTTLSEEKEADESLTVIAESSVNLEAVEEEPK